MTRTLRIVERARSDVDHVLTWLGQRSVQGPISWYLAFRRAIEKIATSLEVFAEAPESHPLGRPLRQAPFKTRRGRVYRVVFEVSDTEIIILRVRGPRAEPIAATGLAGPVTLSQRIGAAPRPRSADRATPPDRRSPWFPTNLATQLLNIRTC